MGASEKRDGRSGWRRPGIWEKRRKSVGTSRKHRQSRHAKDPFSPPSPHKQICIARTRQKFSVREKQPLTHNCGKVSLSRGDFFLALVKISHSARDACRVSVGSSRGRKGGGGIDDSRKWRRKRILREWGWKEGGPVVVCPESLRSKRNHSATEMADTQPLPLNYAYHTADRAESKLQSIAPSPSSCSSLFRRKNCLGRPLLIVVSSPPFHNAAAEKLFFVAVASPFYLRRSRQIRERKALYLLLLLRGDHFSVSHVQFFGV